MDVGSNASLSAFKVFFKYDRCSSVLIGIFYWDDEPEKCLHVRCPESLLAPHSALESMLIELLKIKTKVIHNEYRSRHYANWRRSLAE
jgi:hypothetical protein